MTGTWPTRLSLPTVKLKGQLFQAGRRDNNGRSGKEIRQDRYIVNKILNLQYKSKAVLADKLR